MSVYYVIQHSHFYNRPTLEESGSRKADVRWETDESFGIFTTRVTAMQAWLVALEEIKPGVYEDDFIRKLFGPFQRMIQVRILKVIYRENVSL